MRRHSKIRVWVFSLGILGLCFSALELYCRKFLINQPSRYLEVHSNDFPYFALANEYQSADQTIRNGRRQFYPRTNRPKKVAILGDSVGFCATVGDKECFVEILQKENNEINFDNYSVPGYGLLEVKETLKRYVESQYDAAIYIYNFNDLHPSMPVLLSLLKSQENRFASLSEFGGGTERLKGFLMDHFKLPFVLRYLYSQKKHQIDLAQTNRTVPTQSTPSESVQTHNATPEECYSKWVLEYHHSYAGFPYRKMFPAWKRMLQDPGIRTKLETELLEMKQIADSRGVALALVPFVDLAFFIEKDKSTYNNTLASFKRTGIPFLDTYPLIEPHHQECGFYSDIGHPGRVGNEVLASILQPFLKTLHRPQILSEAPQKLAPTASLDLKHS